MTIRRIPAIVATAAVTLRMVLNLSAKPEYLQTLHPEAHAFGSVLGLCGLWALVYLIVARFSRDI